MKMETLRRNSGPARYLDAVETRRLLDAVIDEPDVRIRTAVLALLLTGVRRGELCHLAWEDIDIDSRVITIHRNRPDVNGDTPAADTAGMRSVRIPAMLIEVWLNTGTCTTSCRFPAVRVTIIQTGSLSSPKAVRCTRTQ